MFLEEEHSFASCRARCDGEAGAASAPIQGARYAASRQVGIIMYIANWKDFSIMQLQPQSFDVVHQRET